MMGIEQSLLVGAREDGEAVPSRAIARDKYSTLVRTHYNKNGRIRRRDARDSKQEVRGSVSKGVNTAGTEAGTIETAGNGREDSTSAAGLDIDGRTLT